MSSSPVSKRSKVRLSDTPAPPDPHDSDMDDGPLTASGRMSKSAKRGGAPPAGASAVEAMMQEATAAKEAGLDKAKADKEALEAQRAALRATLTPWSERLHIGGSKGLRTLVEIDCGSAAAQAALTAGEPVDTLFLLDASLSMATSLDRPDAPSGADMVRRTIELLPELMAPVVGGAEAAVAFGWFGTSTGLYTMDQVTGLWPWMLMSELTEETRGRLAEAYQPNQSGTDIADAIAWLDGTIRQRRSCFGGSKVCTVHSNRTFPHRTGPFHP